MAIAELNNVTVSKVFRGGKGVSVKGVIRLEDGREIDKSFTLWFEDGHELQEGDEIGASGFLSFEISEFPDRETGETVRFVKVSLNNARVKEAEGDHLVPTVSLQDVVVTRFFGVGGVGAEERFEVKGKRQARKFNLWFGVDQDFDTDAVISATGELSTKVRSYTDKAGDLHYEAVVNINEAKLVGNASGGSEPEDDGYDYDEDEDAPF